jgi:hypothetical protein
LRRELLVLTNIASNLTLRKVSQSGLPSSIVMAARGRKFSFMRLVNNAIPNFARDDMNDVDLSPVQADNLVRYQLSQPDPTRLTEESVQIAGLTTSSQISKKVFKALEKNGIISSSADKIPVNTAGITTNFAHQLACISVHAQRKLVGMLFFWEEECTRWRTLDMEEREIMKAIDSRIGSREDLDLALKAIEMKRTMLPSAREDATRNEITGTGDELPAYA